MCTILYQSGKSYLLLFISDETIERTLHMFIFTRDLFFSSIIFHYFTVPASKVWEWDFLVFIIILIILVVNLSLYN